MKFKDEQLNDKQRKIAGVTSVALFIVFFGMLAVLVGPKMVAFVSEPEKFRLWVDSHGIWSRFAFVGMMMFQVVVAVIPGEPLEIGAGYAFGAMEGTLLCLIGMTIGGIIVFGLVRSLGIKMVSVFFSIEKIRSMKFLQNTKRLKTVAFLVFLLPGTPKDLLSYFAGITEIKWSYWVLLTSIVRMPSVITSTLGGDALGGKEYLLAVVVFSVTLVLSLGGLLLYNRISKRKNSRKKRIVLFDLDGTLTESGEGITKCVQYALEKMGIGGYKLEELQVFVGPPLLEKFMSFANFSREEATRAVEFYRERYTRIGIFENRPYEEVLEMLITLKNSGFTLAIASSKPENFVCQIAEHFGLSKCFDTMVGSTLAGERNTKAAVIKEALTRLGADLNSDEVIMVGDREHDVLGAMECDVECVAVSYGYGSLDELNGANPLKIVASVRELEEFLMSKV